MQTVNKMNCQLSLWLCVILMAMATSSNGQNLYLFGDYQEDHFEKISQVIDLPIRSSLFKKKKKEIYYGHEHISTFIQKDRNGRVKLENELRLLRYRDDFHPFPTAQKVQMYCSEIISKSKKEHVFIYDPRGRASSTAYEDFKEFYSELRATADSKKKWIAILVFPGKDVPSVKVNHLVTGQLVPSKKLRISGTASSNLDIAEVKVRNNGGAWQFAAISKLKDGVRWMSNVMLDGSLKNKLEIVATNEDGDSSEMLKVDDLFVRIPKVRLLNPNQSGQALLQCQTTSNYFYKVKIAADTSIGPNDLKVCIIQPNYGCLGEVILGMKWTTDVRIVNGEKIFCLEIPYQVISDSPCGSDLEDDYYLEIRKTTADEIQMPQRLLVHFGSFEDASSRVHRPCNCE